MLPLLLRAVVPPHLPDGYTRRVWQTQDGLPENTVQAFAQTADNYLWIGTSGGLVRFDGAGFLLFNHDNTPVFRDDSVFCLIAARDGSVWAGTEGGGLIRYQAGVFRPYSSAQGLTNPFVRAVYEDRAGVLWAGTDDGLFKLAGDRFARVDGAGNIPTVAVHAIREDHAGNLWVAGSTILQIRGAECREFRLEGLGSAGRAKSIVETADGSMWVGNVAGLQKLPKDGARFKRVSGIASTVRALLVDRSGALWAGSVGEGLMRYADGRFVRVTGSEGPPSSTVLALFEDNEQNIWTGMQTGLLRLSRTPMSTFPLPDSANADFGTVYADRDGSVWVAGTQLFQIDSRRARAELVPAPVAGVRVRNVLHARDGALWIGTEGDGIFRLSRNGRVQYTKATGLTNDFIRALIEARDGSVWIGTDEGLNRWQNGSLSRYREPEGLAYFSIRTLLEDAAGDIWIGTERGLSRWRNGVFLRDDPIGPLSGKKVWAIHQDKDGGMWFGTRGAGLFRWGGGKLVHLEAAKGLASNSIYQILEDARGIFWMSGPNGISAVSRGDLDRVADHPGFRPAVTLYGLSDGVEATQIHGGVSPAGCLTSNGEIWFPSNRGPVRITPLESRSESLPKVALERVLADGHEMPVSGSLKVPPGEGKLQIEYAAVRLRSQERLRFRYILENFDHEWNDALRRRVAYYTNVPPGKYRFRVQALEMNLPESVTEAALVLEFRPHLYREPWFLAVAALAIAGSLLAAYRLRLRQVHASFQAVLGERNRVAREMHDTVIQGCASVSALLEAVASMGECGSPQTRQLLDCARTQVRATVDEARRAVWNLRRGQGGSDVGLLLGEMTEQVSRGSGVTVIFGAAGKPEPVDPAVAHDVLMVAREAVFNAVSHARAAEVRVELAYGSGTIRLSVSDNGCGFDVDRKLSTQGEHFGLLGMRERSERAGGTLRVESLPGCGTQVMVEIPLRSAPAGKPGIGIGA